MKKKFFIIEQKALLTLLSSMQSICSKRTVIDSTSYILFNVGYKELTLKSTDLELSLQSSCDLIESSISEPEQFLVSGKRIFELVKELDGNISCSLNKHQISLQSGDINLSLNIKNPEEFPPFPERIENLMHIDSELLSDMFDKLAPLIPQNNTNSALNGLLVEISSTQLNMTATDGHCLIQASSEKITLKNNQTWLLPRRAIFELKKLLESFQDKTIFIGTCGKQLVFSGEFFNFFSKLLADSFPAYKAILDKESFMSCGIDKSKLAKSLKRSICLLSGNFLATRFLFKDNFLNVSMQNNEVGMLDEQINLSTSLSEPVDIRFYAPYLLSGLNAFDNNDIQFYLKSGTNPIIFNSDNNKGYTVTYLVMPVSATN